MPFAADGSIGEGQLEIGGRTTDGVVALRARQAMVTSTNWVYSGRFHSKEIQISRAIYRNDVGAYRRLVSHDVTSAVGAARGGVNRNS